MGLEESEELLLEKVREEERKYNWIEAATLYEKAINFYLDENFIDKAADNYKNLGYTHTRAADTVETAEEYLKQIKCAIKAYEEAKELFRQLGNKSVELECEAEISSIRGFLATSDTEAQRAYRKAYKLFIESYKIYSVSDDQENVARTLSKVTNVMKLLTFCNIDRGELNQLSKQGREYAKQAWEISKRIGNIQILSESFNSEIWISLNEMLTTNFKDNEYWREYTENFLLKCEESMKLVDKYDDPYTLGLVFSVAGRWYCFFGFQFVENERKQKEYLDKGIELLEKALLFTRNTKNKSGIIECLFFIDYFALYSGRINYLQKRILNDIKDCIELGRIYILSYNPCVAMVNMLPALYYANSSQRSFFTTAQRKIYAEKGIKYATKAMNGQRTSPASTAWLYQGFVLAYSQLTILSESKKEQDENAQKMLQYAKQAEEFGLNYEGGFPQAGGYSSQYRAYKTLADVAESEEERIKAFSSAILAQKKYMNYATESRTGIIAAQMRLGLLYEELGILTKKNDTLLEGKELLLNTIKESLERGYFSYTGTTYEYIARIEDRLGNHTASAENYKKAQESHNKSLKSIEYKLLKDRVKEKIKYALAWNLIETAKAYHKSENHQKAKKNYEDASEILKGVHRYNYEASYYTAWALLEDAEQLSKQERQKKAINQYRTTIKAFENAITALIEASVKSNEQLEKERIEKLEKVAKIRINYCSARINLEEARILGRKGEHSTAADLFASAASKFRGVCTRFKLERERKELEAIYYLCRAWESMELAEKFEEPERFEEAANLFTKASDLFIVSKLKLLALGNSAFCQALEYGHKLEESIEMQVKSNLYPKVKLMLSKASSSYSKGGFEKGANWALATSIYFDAAWHLIQADQISDLNEKGKLLGIGSNYLKSAIKLFGDAGYKDKAKEVQDRLNIVEKEETILFSALSTIKEPSISRSTVGIVAPTCPIESSQSPKLGEARQFTEEERRVALERIERKKYELVYRDLSKEYPKVQKRECRVGVAQIGVSETGNIMNEFYEMTPLGLLNIKENKVEEVRSKVKAMIGRAYDEGVNVLLFPEMTIDLNYGELLHDIAELAKLHSMYIIPGSFHDQETKRNISMVFGAEGILWEQEKHIPAVISIGAGKHFKERIEVSSLPRKTIICNTEYGRIAIVICRDFLDMDLRVELKNFEPPIDIILNPAFTPVTADFKAAHFDARRSIYAYSFFANIGEFGESLIYTPEKDRTKRIIPAKKESLIFKDIDLFKLRSERKKWEKKQNKERLFIQSTR